LVGASLIANVAPASAGACDAFGCEDAFHAGAHVNVGVSVGVDIGLSSGARARNAGHPPYSYHPDTWRYVSAGAPCVLRQPIYDRFGFIVGYDRIPTVC
jgi:uncharacterized membrane protein